MTGVASILIGPASSAHALTCTGDRPGSAPWSEVVERAGSMAARLANEREVAAGTIVQVPAEPSIPVVATILAAWIAGASIRVEAGAPADTDAPEVRCTLDADQASALWDYAAALGPSVAPPDRADQVLIRQRTSGTTGRPEEVAVTAQALFAHVDATAAAADLHDPNEVACSWLPLFHDMGLVGMLCLPLVHGQRLVLSPPSSFRANPRSWFAACAEHGATLTAAPNFAYRIALRTMGSSVPELRRMRAMVNGGEPIRPDTLADLRAYERAGGVPPGAHRPAYGLAQAPLCVSITRPRQLVDLVPSPLAPSDEWSPHVFPGASFVALGAPIDGIEVWVAEPAEALRLPDGVGELVVRGHVDPESPVRTGDLGFLFDGQVVVCGRTKDLIVLGGRNILPEVVERSAEAVPSIRAGGVVAFADHDGSKERIVVACEASAPSTGLAASVAQQVLRTIGVRPEVVLVAPRSLPKTTSGKLRRARCRELHHLGQLTPA